MDFDFQYFIELFYGGLTRGSIYALIALGYTLVYGIIGLLNFPHGEIYMNAAFTPLHFSGDLRPPGPDFRLRRLPGSPPRHEVPLLLRRCHGPQ